MWWESAALWKGAGLANKWIPLLYKQLRKIRKKRKTEFRQLAEIAGGADPVQLAKVYVQPDVQLIDPATHRDEDSPLESDRRDFRRQINIFLRTSPAVKESGRHVLFLLAGAGMGKTSAMIMLYMSQYCDFWPKEVKFQLFKLGPTTRDDIREVEEPADTVLLLDSLDEDPCAYGDLKARLLDLLDATTGFRHVVVTCRTQFFPEKSIAEQTDQPREAWSRIEIGGYRCGLLYLSPFSEDQSREYLEKRYPVWNWAVIRHWLREQESLYTSALALTKTMGTLTMRPLLLAYVDDLIDDADLDVTNIGAVYERIVKCWIGREVVKLRRHHGKRVVQSELLAICEIVALELHKAGERSISEKRLASLLSADELGVLSPIDVGGRSLLNRTHLGQFQFAHKTVQEYLFASWVQREPGDLSLHGIKHLSGIELRFLRDLSVRSLAWVTHGNLGAIVGKFKKLVVLELSKSIAFRDAKLRDARFRGADLQYADLQGAELQDVDLQYADLRGAKLQGADLRGAKLQGAKLQDAKLQGAKLECASLRYAELVDAGLQGANLYKAKLLGADLRKAGLQNAKLQDAKLQNAKLSGAKLQKAELEKADLQNAKLQNAKLQYANLPGANLPGANLQNGNLQGANLRGANLQDANLPGANLQDADLQDAKLQNAKLQGAKLEGADLQEANLLRANLQGATLQNAKLYKADLQDANLQDANLQDANLLGADLQNAKLQGAKLPQVGLGPLQRKGWKY